MATVYQPLNPGIGRLAIDPKTRKLLNGLAAVGVTYCRIQSSGITTIPSRGKVREAVISVMETVEPNYKAQRLRKQYHGFRCGEYQADPKTGELKLIER